MRTTMFLYSAIIAFFVGVATQSLFHFDVSVLVFFLVLAGALAVYWKIVRTQVVLLVWIMFVMIVFGMGRFAYSEYRLDVARADFEESAPHEVVQGVVIGEVVEKETTRRFTIATPETNIVVIAERFPEIRYGDYVALTGDVRIPESFKTDTGREFNYPQYLAARGVTHQMFRPVINVVDTGGGSFVTRNLFHLKDVFLNRVRSVIPEPHVALLGGLVVGSQEAMGEDLLEAFRVTGLIHIVVLSGYNVTIVAESIMRFFGFLPKRSRMVVGVVSIVLFAILTGATATIVRASIMALLVILARATGRTYELIRALAVTAFLMVLYNPYIFLFDPSFQLSFLATLGLIYLVPLFEQTFAWLGKTSTIRSLVFATVATQIFVLPLLLYQAGILSTVSIPVNALVLPVIPMIMFFGFVTGVVGLLSPLVAMPFAFVSYIFLDYILRIVDWFSSFSFAALYVESFSVSGVIFIYVLYAMLLFIFLRKIKNKNLVSEGNK